MYKSWILWLIAASIAGAASGDVLVTKDGQRIETRGPWTVEKGVVEFTNVKGTFLSIRLTEIDLEASEEATERSAQAREKLHDEEMDEEPETNPMAAVILQSRAEEKTESVREFTHEEIAGQSLRQFRRDVAKVLAGVDLLKRRYDLSKPEGIHRASAYLQNHRLDVARAPAQTLAQTAKGARRKA